MLYCGVTTALRSINDDSFHDLLDEESYTEMESLFSDSDPRFVRYFRLEND